MNRRYLIVEALRRRPRGMTEAQLASHLHAEGLTLDAAAVAREIGACVKEGWPLTRSKEGAWSLGSGVIRVQVTSDADAPVTDARELERTTELLKQAITSGGAVELTYDSWTSGVASHRRIAPHELKEKSGHLYVTATDLDGGERRSFRVDRMSEASPAGPAANLSDAAAADSILVRVKGTEPATFLSGLGSRAGASVSPDGPKEFLVRAAEAPTAALADYIFRFGDAVVVEHPPQLKRDVQARALALLAAYVEQGARNS